jgi:hypothetical protein
LTASFLVCLGSEQASQTPGFPTSPSLFADRFLLLRECLDWPFRALLFYELLRDILKMVTSVEITPRLRSEYRIEPLASSQFKEVSEGGGGRLSWISRMSSLVMVLIFAGSVDFAVDCCTVTRKSKPHLAIPRSTYLPGPYPTLPY